MRISDYDALELHTVVPVDGGYEQVIEPGQLVSGSQHGLYGHLPPPGVGVEWIADFDTAGEARMAAAEVSEGRQIFDYLVEVPADDAHVDTRGAPVRKSANG